ncbi:MAG: hypothetical protein EZS28_028155 [Streblomastix strix]|uniref:Uncharacterized protein n=1 Tax=Streblomastix strix TaxID=222440 RepID=A0A5J4V0R9_9EUKA|nr:MAG: hypothetical protein EZS28_028155 [Streblomastix strix]
MKFDKLQGIIIAPIWPRQSWNTELKTVRTKYLFLELSDRILEIGQKMKDKDLKFPTNNVSTFLLDLSQTQEEIYY